MDKLNRNQQCVLTAIKVNHTVVCVRSIEKTSRKVTLHFAEYYENTSEVLCLFGATQKKRDKQTEMSQVKRVSRMEPVMPFGPKKVLRGKSI